MIPFIIRPNAIPIAAADNCLLTVHIKGHRLPIPHAGDRWIGRVVLTVNLG